MERESALHDRAYTKRYGRLLLSPDVGSEEYPIRQARKESKTQMIIRSRLKRGVGYDATSASSADCIGDAFDVSGRFAWVAP